MIYTFYSYKGGVGRSMALANIGELFYQAGRRVLLVDWDLEAPGLERFFPAHTEAVMDRPGVIEMLLDYKAKMAGGDLDTLEDPTALPFLRPADLMYDLHPDADGRGRLWMLSAGRRYKSHFSKYATALGAFDWADFYQHWEGDRYFQWLRKQLNNTAEVVLIDSRTGVSEMGGVCTYQLADAVVILCATNQQNVEGTYEMAWNFTRPKVRTLRKNRELPVLILPARVEDRGPAGPLEEFHTQFVQSFGEFLPEVLGDDPEILWALRIPYEPQCAFNELIVAQQQEMASFRPLVEVFYQLVYALTQIGLQRPGADTDPGEDDFRLGPVTTAISRPPTALRHLQPPPPLAPQLGGQRFTADRIPLQAVYKPLPSGVPEDSRVRVRFIDMHGGQTTGAEIHYGMTIESVIYKLVQHGFVSPLQPGQEYVMLLKRANMRLLPNQTLYEAGVQEGDLLQAGAVMRGG